MQWKRWTTWVSKEIQILTLWQHSLTQGHTKETHANAPDCNGKAKLQEFPTEEKRPLLLDTSVLKLIFFLSSQIFAKAYCTRTHLSVSKIANLFGMLTVWHPDKSQQHKQIRTCAVIRVSHQWFCDTEVWTKQKTDPKGKRTVRRYSYLTEVKTKFSQRCGDYEWDLRLCSIHIWQTILFVLFITGWWIALLTWYRFHLTEE